MRPPLASSTKPACEVHNARQPTMRRANLSIAKATWTKPARVGTWLRSETQSISRACACKWRLARSNANETDRSLIVVLTGLPLITPARPMARISWATVQRAK